MEYRILAKGTFSLASFPSDDSDASDLDLSEP